MQFFSVFSLSLSPVSCLTETPLKPVLHNPKLILSVHKIYSVGNVALAQQHSVSEADNLSPGLIQARARFNSSPHVRQSMKVLDSGFHAMNFGFQVLCFGLCVSGTWIPDSMNCILHCKAQVCRFRKQKFSRLRIPGAKISRISSVYIYFGRRRILIPESSEKNSSFTYKNVYNIQKLLM